MYGGEGGGGGGLPFQNNSKDLNLSYNRQHRSRFYELFWKGKPIFITE